MDLSGLLALVRSDARYRAFVAQLRARMDAGARAEGAAPHSIGLLEAARPYLIAALRQDWPGPILVVSGSPEEARQLADQIDAWSGAAERGLYLQAPDALFYDRTAWDRDTIQARVNVLGALAHLSATSEEHSGAGTVITTSMWALMTKSAPPMAFRRALRSIAVGQTLPPNDLLAYSVRAGYEPVAVVEEPGTFSRRGSIVDIYPPNLSQPLRIDFFGDVIDSLRAYDPATQRSAQPLTQATLSPASEALPEWGRAAAAALGALDLTGCDQATQHRLREQIEQLARGEHLAGIEYYLPYLYPRPATLLDYLPSNALVLLDDTLRLESAAQTLVNQALSLRAEMLEAGQLPAGFAVPYLTWEEMNARLAAQHAVDLGYGLEEEGGLYPGQEGFIAAAQYGGRFQDALEDIAELRRKGQRTVLVTRQAERLADLLHDENIYATPVTDVTAPPEEGAVTLVDGILAQGWAFVPGRLMVLTDAEVFGWSRPRKRRTVRRRAASPESFYADLQRGRLSWCTWTMASGAIMAWCARPSTTSSAITWRSSTRPATGCLCPSTRPTASVAMWAPTTRTPYMHRLGGTRVGRRCASARKRPSNDIAAELLELYAAREVTPGHAFSADTAWQHELEGSFPYEETDDQLRALTEVKGDMERPKPMDRLLCGDVGYGKTEVALRAAFKAVMDGKQVAMLVPTTVLAQQHFYTFRRRLRAFPGHGGDALALSHARGAGRASSRG